MGKSTKPRSTGARAGSADYPVGYGKPPEASKFKKGRSGNPSGASKKARARKADGNSSPFGHIMLDEVGRAVAINDNGKRTKITAARAISRSLMIDAVKGNRSAQKLVLDQVQTAHDRQQTAARERFGMLVQYFASRTSTHNSPTAPTPHDLNFWPHPDDIKLDYGNFTGQVVGPIDAQQAQRFIALVTDHRIWRARLDQVLAMASPSSADIRAIYETAVGTITHLLSAIRAHLPPSFKAQLDWDDGEFDAAAFDIDGLNDGEIVNLAQLPPESNEMVYGLYQLFAGAMAASEQVRDRAKLNIAANTTSLINRLQIEKQNRDGGAPPAAAVPDLAQFYDGLELNGDDSADEAAP